MSNVPRMRFGLRGVEWTYCCTWCYTAVPEAWFAEHSLPAGQQVPCKCGDAKRHARFIAWDVARKLTSA